MRNESATRAARNNDSLSVRLSVFSLLSLSLFYSARFFFSTTSRHSSTKVPGG